MKIVILGDVGASSSNEQAFCNADKDLFSTEIQDICTRADIVLLNLEKPLTDELTPLGKCPPDFLAPVDTINGIKLLRPDMVTLANNHIMDQREQGLKSTIEILTKNGIQYVGAGNNINEARIPGIISKQGVSVGIYACCEKEFSFATEKTAGANAFDPLESFDDIIKLKKQCDYLIVLFHGGMQDYPYPTPYQQRVCQKMCDKGADFVICQHSHIIGCEEKYANGRIVYGQGNFILDEVPDESWHTGLMIEVNLEEKKDSVEYIPILTQNNKVILHPDPSSIKREFAERSCIIKEKDVVDELFAIFSNKALSDYLIRLSGRRNVFRRIIRKLGIMKYYRKLYSAEACNMILDYLYCDSHRESIEYGLKELINEKKKHAI